MFNKKFVSIIALALFTSSCNFDIKPPTAEILFPWKASATNTPVIRVRGIAQDNVGVRSVTVNGILAEITPMETEELDEKSRFNFRKYGISAADYNIDEDNIHKQVQWEARLELVDDTTDIVVAVEDLMGNYVSNADSASIDYVRVLPDNFSLDSDNNRVLGITPPLFSFTPPEVIEFNLLENTRRSAGAFDTQGPSKNCYKKATDKIFTSIQKDNFTYDVVSFDLNTAAQSTVFTYTFSPGEEDPVNFIQLENILCNDGDDSVYLVAELFSNDNNKIVIVEIALADSPNARVLFDATPEVPFGNPFVSALTNEASIIAYLDNKLVSISTFDGSLRVLQEPYFAFSSSIVEGSTSEFIYVVNFDQIDRITTATGEITALSPESDGTLYEFSQPQDSALDAENNRILVSDSDLTAIIGVDLVSGERSIVGNSGRGDGVKLTGLRDFVFNSDLSKAYLAVDGGNASERLVVVDLATGDRASIGDINNRFNVSVSSVDLDEQTGKAYFAGFDAIYSVDLASGETITLASEEIGNGFPFARPSGMRFDGVNRRLVYSDIRNEALVAIDLNTLQRELISQAGGKGEGEAFDIVNTLTLDSEKQVAYVSNQESGAILHVDLETGDRQRVTNNCASSVFIQDLHLGPNKKTLYFVDFSVYGIDLDTLDCNSLPGSFGSSTIRVPQEGNFFLGKFLSLNYYDPELGNQVIISQ